MSAAAASRARWVEGMRGAHVLELAAALGLQVADPKHSSGGSFAPCPACARTLRHEKRGDHRLACGVRSRGDGWHCFACDATGDGLHLVALVRAGARLGDLRDDQRADVRDWCTRFLGGEIAATTRPHLELVRTAPTYPPESEVAELWRSCAPVTSDQAIARWLWEARALDPVALDAHGLARALPRGAVGPLWARTGEDGHAWSATGFRLVFPLYDATGHLRSVLARNARADAVRKSSAALGFARSGLVLADRAGLAMLRGRLDAGFGGERLVVIAEGEMDFAVASMHLEHPEGARAATLGIFSGSWSRELAARIPSGSRVVIATHPDDAGDSYAETIVETLLERDVVIARLRR